MKHILVFFSLLAFVLTASPLYAQNAVGLFHIERNKNANIVQYDANMIDGVINSNNPIDAYWILNASNGQRAELSSFERRAFGFRVTRNNDGHYDLVLQAVPERPIKVILIDGVPKAEILINNREAFLSKVFVSATSNFVGIPRVSYYTLYGVDVETGKEVSEQINVR
ncbi:MAG: DUF4833 domain-containing protein [Endomicrobia bacterium]|nr:DUF4833 domain-containing protein [Endomicrobiia bacterium]MCL2506873.1 DUF4833 domain-containing protein [Endomicrobiia bacterium]